MPELLESLTGDGWQENRMVFARLETQSGAAGYLPPPEERAVQFGYGIGWDEAPPEGWRLFFGLQHAGMPKWEGI